MEHLQLEDVDVLIIEPESSTRQAIRNILSDNGFNRIRTGSDMSDIRDQFMLGWPDLLISEFKLEGGSFKDFIFKLRHHELGGNPFLPVIATAWSPEQEEVLSIVHSGVDDLITKPLSAGQLLNRIKALIIQRKPFIVTSAYIGPDRRKLEDRTSAIPQLDVPNILRAKARGEVIDPQQFQAQVDQMVGSINLQKMERHAVQVKFLIDRISPSLEAGKPDAEASRALKRLLFVSEDIARRMVGTKYAHVSNLCQTLIHVTTDILRAGTEPADKDVKLLQQMSRAITAGFSNVDSETAAAARTISQTLNR